MTKIKYILWSVIALALFSSCKKTENTAPASQVTYLPKMALQGASSITVPCGETFTDPGIEVTESGKPINHDEAISGAYFGETTVGGPDQYTIAYSAVNKDGIPGSAFRSVLVMPCNSGGGDISGLYSFFVHRVSNGEEYDGLTNGFVVKTGANTYAISDCIGGFYDLGRGYGSDYACKGSIFTVNSSTDITATDGTVPGFGFSTTVHDISIDADGKISFTASASFTDWEVVMTPQ